MTLSIFIFEMYTKPEITPKYENSRVDLVKTNLYLQMDEEEKILVDEYIELDLIVGEYFYTRGIVNKFVNHSNDCQIIQILFPTEEVFVEFLQDAKYNAIYYQYLTGEVWHKLFGVQQEVVFTRSYETKNKMDNFEQALIEFENCKKLEQLNSESNV